MSDGQVVQEEGSEEGGGEHMQQHTHIHSQHATLALAHALEQSLSTHAALEQPLLAQHEATRESGTVLCECECVCVYVYTYCVMSVCALSSNTHMWLDMY